MIQHLRNDINLWEIPKPEASTQKKILNQSFELFGILSYTHIFSSRVSLDYLLRPLTVVSHLYYVSWTEDNNTSKTLKVHLSLILEF